MCPIAHVPHHPCPHLDLYIMAICHIAHVPHCSCGLLPMCPITLLPCRPRRGHATLPICPITPVPQSPMYPITLPLVLMCPIAHVAFCPCTPLPYSHVDLEGHMPHCWYAPSPLFPWVVGHTGDGAAKCQMMWSCQKDVNCQKSNILTMDYI